MKEFLAIPDFSKLWLMRPGSPKILIRTLLFCGDAWHVTVSPVDFIKGVPSSITVSVSLRCVKRSASPINVSLEILDNTWERTVFHAEDVVGNYVHVFLTVKRSELEVTSCVHNDSISVRCTLTCIDMKKHKKATASSKWWRQLRRSLSQNLLAPLKISNSNLTEGASMMMTADDRPSTIHHLITIPAYSKLAQMPTASSLTLCIFPFLGYSWSIKLFPNGSNGTSAGYIAIMAVRHSDLESADSGTYIAIEIFNESHKQASIFYEKQMLGGDDNLWFSSTLMVNGTELEAASCLNKYRFTITCTLPFLHTKQQQQDKEKMIRTIPRITDESDSVHTPLLSHEKLFTF